VEPPEAYERLLLECMLGDSTLFTRIDETEYSWRLVDSIENAWAKQSPSSTVRGWETLPVVVG